MSVAAVRVTLAGELTVRTAAEHREQTLAQLAEVVGAGGGPAGLELDLEGVTELDTAGIQVLLVLRREALAAEVELAVVAVSAPVAEVLTLAGLDLHLAPARGDADDLTYAGKAGVA